MTFLSSPNDFDPRLLINQPLLFLLWFKNPDIEIFRQPRKAIHLSTRLHHRRHHAIPPLSNEQLLSLKTQYYLEWQLLTLTVFAMMVSYFMLNPLLLFYSRFQVAPNIESQYASLLFIIFYGSCIVSLIFWMCVSRLSIWNGSFKSSLLSTPQTSNSETNKRKEILEANRKYNKYPKDENKIDSDSSDENSPINEQKQISSNLSKMKKESELHSHYPKSNPMAVATNRVTGFIVALRWTLFGFALSLGIFAAATTFEELILASAVCGFFFPNLIVTSTNVIIYKMKRLPIIDTFLKIIYYIIILGWIFIPLITCILAEYTHYKVPFVVFAIILLVCLLWVMCCRPGKSTIDALITDKETEILDKTEDIPIGFHPTHRGHQDPSSLLGLTATTKPAGSLSSLKNNSTIGGLTPRGDTSEPWYDDTTPLRAGATDISSSAYEDDDSSVISDTSSIFRLPGESTLFEIANLTPSMGPIDEDAERRRSMSAELERMGIYQVSRAREQVSTTFDFECLDSPIVKGSCKFNFKLLSSSMGVFQIGTFFLSVQAFCSNLCIGVYLTWYPTVMYDRYGQKFVLSGIQMSLTGIVVVFFATFVAKRSLKQYFLYSLNVAATFFIIILAVAMIRLDDIMLYWFVFPLIMASIVTIGMILNMMLTRITPNGCLSFINGSTQIFQLAAFGIGPVIMGVVDTFNNTTQSDYYFWCVIYSALAVEVCVCLGLFMIQCLFTAIKVWGLGTDQKNSK